MSERYHARFSCRLRCRRRRSNRRRLCSRQLRARVFRGRLYYTRRTNFACSIVNIADFQARLIPVARKVGPVMLCLPVLAIAARTRLHVLTG
jgi:hypothetical protein